MDDLHNNNSNDNSSRNNFPTEPDHIRHETADCTAGSSMLPTDFLLPHRVSELLPAHTANRSVYKDNGPFSAETDTSDNRVFPLSVHASFKPPPISAAFFPDTAGFPSLLPEYTVLPLFWRSLRYPCPAGTVFPAAGILL